MSKNFIFQSFVLVFKDLLFIFLALSISLNLLALYYFFFFQTTTFFLFARDNSAFYVWASIISTLLISFSFGVSMSFIIWQKRFQKTQNIIGTENGLIGAFLGAVSTGCPVCGSFLPAILGISGGLAAFPFQGLEIKAISLGLLIFSVISLARSISKKGCADCGQIEEEKLFHVEDKKIAVVLNKNTLKPILPAALGIFLLILVAYFPAISNKFDFGFAFQKNSLAEANNYSLAVPADAADVLQKINPSQGYATNAIYGNIGPRLLAVGAIDLGKMKELYQDAGMPLTQEQIKILTEGSAEKIKITPENSYFLLNFLWALGLANRNAILDEGPMVENGKNQLGNFASTGGWTLGNKKSTELFSNFEIIKLTPEQQKVLEDFADNAYRPCCSNPTSFPDCNHGMAALALGEIMASQGAAADEIFEAFKYFNAFWFPQTYFDVATYFQAKEGKEWSQVSGRLVAGKDYSTPQGWQRVRQWLSANGYLQEVPSSGGGCGV